MPKGPLMLASFGLAVNVFLWGVPGMVAAAGASHLVLPNYTLSISEGLTGLEQTSGPTPSLEDALMKLIGAESDALQVAGAGLQQPTPPDMASRANAAGVQVEDAVLTYVRAAQQVVSR
ncbi:MAG: hypothetical protein JO318_09020 [Chloroflexi bacterium]|nr:hypothetical protein [Chloroflexota bacterium]MBV9132828.1 hypothetical protein [Chloroflexota bacterium]